MQSQLPAWLSQATDQQLNGISGKALAAEYERLSGDYRLGLPSRPRGDARLYWLAYLAGRLPATYAALQAAFRQIPAPLTESCASLLDLGSGPGTAVWAALDFFPALRSAVAVEQSAEAVALGEALSTLAPLKPRFERNDMNTFLKEGPGADLVILSYAAVEAGSGIIEAAAAKAAKLFVLVEPGTPAGFKAVLEARQKVEGLVAPCPQDGACPMAAASETKWCHFSARLERSRMARLMKGGDLGYEDEKFSYAVFSKMSAPRAPARIVGYPRKSEGRVSLELCEPGGLRVLDLKKNEKDVYKKSKKAGWGQPWPLSAA